jgi:hypothetical protein
LHAGEFLLEDGLGRAAEQRVTRPEVVGRRPRRQLRFLVEPAVGQSLQAWVPSSWMAALRTRARNADIHPLCA